MLLEIPKRSEGSLGLSQSLLRKGQTSLDQMTKASKLGAFVGFAIAVLVLVYSVSETIEKISPIDDWLVVAACPPSIYLVATETLKWPGAVLVSLIVTLLNTVWYALIFGVVGRMFATKS